MSNNEISQILSIILGVMIFILMILVVIFIILKANENKKEKKAENILSGKEDKDIKKKEEKHKIDKSYSKQSIMDFMEFEKVEDNMIVQKKGRRYLMVVECQGINYDLMSQPEKIAVEEGFQQFLNTLRHPIQIYIQTRTINLENSINTYKTKIKEVEDSYNQNLFRYNQMREAGIYSQEDIEKSFYELTKQRNLLEYGRDLVANTEKMSLNRSILNKNYYIIIPYFSEDAGEGQYDYEEIKNMAFSELYTKAQSIISTLKSSSINGKILTSQELVELLYVAYNRDDSEIFGIEKAAEAGYDELYSTAPDVFEKKIKVLDEMIRQKGIELANETIEKVKSKPQQVAEEKENNLEELVRKMAQMVLEENKAYVGTKTAEKAIKELNNSKKEGENANEKVKEKKTTRRKRTTTK